MQVARQQPRCSSLSAQSQRAWTQPRVACRATPSIDPLSVSDGTYRPGKLFPIHGPDDLKKFTETEPYKSRLTVLMCKSSSCRPCKKYMATYHELASVFKDCALLEIVGDENQTTRKMMIEMKVKSTPTFFLYRNGVQVGSQIGTASNGLPKLIRDKLLPDEAGLEWRSPTVSASSDDED